MDPPAPAPPQRHDHEYPDYVDLSDLTDEQQSSSASDSEDSHGGSICIPEEPEEIHHYNGTFETHTSTTGTSTRSRSIEGDGMEEVTTKSRSHCEKDGDGASGNEADIDSDSDDSSISTTTSAESATARMPAESMEAATGQVNKVVDTSACTTGNNTPNVKQFAADLTQQQYDPSRMELSKEEHRWALAVKDAIEKLPDLDRLSDFNYAALAILSKGNIANAVDRAYRLQTHLRNNHIMDTYDDALRNIPGGAHWLSIDYNLHTGGYIAAMDITKTDRSMFRSPEQIRYYHRRAFYAGQMALCDLTALRAGTTVLIECEGYRPKYKLNNAIGVDLRSFQEMFECMYATPRNVTKVKFFNSSPVFNLLIWVSKKALPKETTSKFQVVPKCPMGNLNTLYNIPSPEVAKARLQERMKGLLQKRYLNEMSFTLARDSPVAPPEPKQS